MGVVVVIAVVLVISFVTLVISFASSAPSSSNGCIYATIPGAVGPSRFTEHPIRIRRALLTWVISPHSACRRR